MDNFWAMVLLAEQERSLWKMLGPLLAMVAIVVFGWINEKVKKKERQQHAEDEARRKAEGGAGRSEPTRPQPKRDLVRSCISISAEPWTFRVSNIAAR